MQRYTCGTHPGRLPAAAVGQYCHIRCLLLYVGEDVGHYGGSYKVTYDLYKKFGDMRVLDTPICGELARRERAVALLPDL